MKFNFKFDFLKSKTVHQSDRADINMLLGEKTPFAIREAFRTLYTNVIYLPIEDNCKKIAVTSALPGETKTYVSINLAITLAENSDNHKILLVDMDMRKPRVARLIREKFGLDSKIGLSEYLAGITEEPNICQTSFKNLSILFSGASCLNPAGLINSAKMTELIKYCEEKYDYIIFDTPPVNVVSDAVLLSNKINGYLIATRADYSSVGEISEALDMLEKVKANVFGFVLSDVELKKTHGYGYRAKYSKSDYRYYE